MWHRFDYHSRCQDFLTMVQQIDSCWHLMPRPLLRQLLSLTVPKARWKRKFQPWRASSVHCLGLLLYQNQIRSPKPVEFEASAPITRHATIIVASGMLGCLQSALQSGGLGDPTLEMDDGHGESLVKTTGWTFSKGHANPQVANHFPMAAFSRSVHPLLLGALSSVVWGKVIHSWTGRFKISWTCPNRV